MKRLQEKNINTAQEYDRIYLERTKQYVDSQDMRRWKRLLKYYKGGKILDIGCLDSRIVDLIYTPTDYTGIDIAEEAIKDMQDKFNGNFKVMDLYDMDFAREAFDYVVLGEVIEHLEKPEEAIKEAMRALKPKGVLALSTPLDEAQEVGAVDSDRHLWSFTVDDVVKLLKPYGKVKTAVLGSEYFPVYKYHWPTLIAWCTKKG